MPEIVQTIKWPIVFLYTNLDYTGITRWWPKFANAKFSFAEGSKRLFKYNKIHHKNLNLVNFKGKKEYYVCYEKQLKMRANKGLYRIKSPYFGLWKNSVATKMIMNITVSLELTRAAINPISGLRTFWISHKQPTQFCLLHTALLL